MVAFALSPIMIEYAGWPTVFHVFGTAGLLWCVAWQLLIEQDIESYMPPNTRDPCANGNANVDARTRAASTLNSTRKGSSTNMMNDHAFITSSNGNKDNRKGIRGRNEDIDSSSDLGELLLPITLPNNSNDCSRHLSSSSSSSSSSSAVSIPRQVLTMVKSAPVLAITGSHFSNNFGGFMMLSWLPSMLKDEFGLDGT